MSPLSLSISKCPRPSSSKSDEKNTRWWYSSTHQIVTVNVHTAQLHKSKKHNVHNSPVTKVKVTVPFFPASKSLANMFVTKDPAGRPAQICNKERDMYWVNYIGYNNISTTLHTLKIYCVYCGSEVHSEAVFHTYHSYQNSHWVDRCGHIVLSTTLSKIQTWTFNLNLWNDMDEKSLKFLKCESSKHLQFLLGDKNKIHLKKRMIKDI